MMAMASPRATVRPAVMAAEVSCQVDGSDVRIGGGEIVENDWRAIVAAVVDEDQFVIQAQLIQSVAD
jgi:hypothetical protein